MGWGEQQHQPTLSGVPIGLLDDLARTVDAYLLEGSESAYAAMKKASERVQQARRFPGTTWGTVDL